MEAVTGEEIVGDFWAFLHDGAYLCRLINKLEPGTVSQKLETPSTAPFKQVYNIIVYFYYRLPSFIKLLSDRLKLGVMHRTAY